MLLFITSQCVIRHLQFCNKKRRYFDNWNQKYVYLAGRCFSIITLSKWCKLIAW